MNSRIHVLPPYVANQIAAGEVVNRPASALKELMENAVDAEASSIDVYIKEGGRSLIQVVDNGKGMNQADAELCFLRHATSKIKQAEDLYEIKTMGFRGEALASMAAISHIELKTRPYGEELGFLVQIEGSEIVKKEVCQCSFGTSIAIHHLYYNTPARREFLKKDDVEFRYIEEEFMRIALSHPHIKFSLYKDEKKIYGLEFAHLNQRIVQLMGGIFQSRLVKIDEKLQDLSVSGYICKPDYTSKTRSKQYMFVNGRYVKHHSLNHAIESAFKELVPDRCFPAYFIFIHILPKNIDVNIHPTKAEVRFSDEKLLYGVLNSAVKHAIGLHNISPSIDFDTTNRLDISIPSADYIPPAPELRRNPNYNPFESGQFKAKKEGMASESYKREYLNSFEKLYNPNLRIDARQFCEENPSKQLSFPIVQDFSQGEEEQKKAKFFQIHQSYILAPLKSGLLIVNQQAAHEKILFEEFISKDSSHRMEGQRSLFPETLRFSPSNTELLKEIHHELSLLGWDIQCVGGNDFLVAASPLSVENGDEASALENILDIYKQKLLGSHFNKLHNISVASAKQMAFKKGRVLQKEEMEKIIDRLFACQNPGISPSGEKTFVILSLGDLDKLFI